IWKEIRHKDFTGETKYFMWMTVHDAYMVGSNWQRPNYKPELQERAICQRCRKLEDAEHILTQCQCNGQKTIWSM
ncbi:hypothetical protein L218DRAFT_807598, partial [Marasmius fiardii PR-910]